MRTFSKFEQDIIHKMIDIYDKNGLNVLSNITSIFTGVNCIPACCYIALDGPTKVTLMVKASAINASPTFMRELDCGISKTLISIVSLFKYLEDEHLAHFFGNYDLKTLGDRWREEKYIPADFLNIQLQTMVYNYSRCNIYITETLRMFVANGFRTDEEVRYEKELTTAKHNLRNTQYALGVTFIGLVLSVAIPLLSTTSVRIKNDKLTNTVDIPGLIDFKKSQEITSSQIIAELRALNIQIAALNNSVQKGASSNASCIKTLRDELCFGLDLLLAKQRHKND